jgi:hypothetical protein
MPAPFLPPGPGGIPVPPYPDQFYGPRYAPFFDGRFGRGETTNPAINRLFDITHATQGMLEAQSYYGSMPGYDPNLAFYQNTIAPGLGYASQLYNQTMGQNHASEGDGGSHGSSGGGGFSLGGFATRTAAGAAIGTMIAPGIGTAIGGALGAIASFF